MALSPRSSSESTLGAAATQPCSPWPSNPGPQAKPAAATFWQKYLNYNAYSQAQVWNTIGGNIKQLFDGENSCAARVSYGLNYAGMIIPSLPEFQTNLNTADGKRYIVSAAKLRCYLHYAWGTPNFEWGSGKSIQNITQLRAQLGTSKIAVIGWNSHSAVITNTYADGNATHGTGINYNVAEPQPGIGWVWILQ